MIPEMVKLMAEGGIVEELFAPAGEYETRKRTAALICVTCECLISEEFQISAMYGTGWSCSSAVASNITTVSCTNGSVVAQGSSYPPLTIDVNVSSTASPGSVTNQVSVIGAGVKGATSNTDSVTILPAAVLAVQKSHTGIFTRGQTAQWNIIVSNTAAAGMTNGTVTVSDTLPANYTLNSYTSTGAVWNCSGVSSVICTTTGGIAGGSSSMISLTVNVPTNSTTSVSNTASAWGGGDLTHTNPGSAATGSDSGIPVVAAGLQFVSVTPCRVADTRNSIGPFG